MRQITTSEAANRVLTWLGDYRMIDDEFELVQLSEGLLLGAALAARHPEYLAAFAKAACDAADEEMISTGGAEVGIESGHSWLELGEVVDLLVDQCPLQRNQ